MTNIQFDALYSTIVRIEAMQVEQNKRLSAIEINLESLTQKALVVGDIDKDIIELQQQIKQIKDEVNA